MRGEKRKTQRFQMSVEGGTTNPGEKDQERNRVVMRKNTELCLEHNVFEGPASEPGGGCLSRVGITRLRAMDLNLEFIPLEKATNGVRQKEESARWGVKEDETHSEC